MSLPSGTRLGTYEIIGSLGAGGMGEVYRARDTKLDRDVAIKVVPDSFAADADRVARFTREAKTLASLNHPNIAQIYGIEESTPSTLRDPLGRSEQSRGATLRDPQGRPEQSRGAVRALVMELVEGEDLSQVIARGPVPLADALPIARQIAEALEAAHEAGIIHRDLKPANIKVRTDGAVKVLDFGLAKALAPDGANATADVLHSPTMTARATQMGVILGTAAYMAPEQAKGRPVDRRADIWAFGVVLFEMLTGRRGFEGEDVSETLAAVLTRELDWTTLPAGTPARVRALVRDCLVRDPKQRLRDIGDARRMLADRDVMDPVAAAPAPAAPARSGRWWMPAAALALIAGVALGRYALVPATPPAETIEFDVTVPGRAIETGSFALSPDGRRLALVIREGSGDPMLAVREMTSAQARVLPGTKGASYPFWSPDGREIGFFADKQLSRIALDGAAARPVATVTDPRGGSWGSGDVILIGTADGPILRVPASGGTRPAPATEIEKGVEESHAWPAFLPDGKRFVFLADASTDDGHRIRLGSVDGGPTTILKRVVRSQPLVDPAGRLLLGERGQLLAYPFDLVRGALGEESALIAAPIFPMGNQHHLPASAAARGMVAFEMGSAENNLVMLDHAGRVTRTIGSPERFGNVAVSPNGKRVAFEIFGDSSEKLIWVEDLERGVRTPVSRRGKSADSAAWSPDGETVYFDSNASGKWEVFRKAVTGGGEPEALGGPDGISDTAVLDVSPDGRWLLAGGLSGPNRRDLYLRSLDASGAWKLWTGGPADEGPGTFSPDSQWIVYSSDDSGRAEVYVAPLVGGPAAHRWPISSAGGFEPRFSADGKTIYYRSAAFDWTAVDVRLASGKVEAGTPKALFPMPVIDLPFLRNYMALLPGGAGFMTIQPPSTKATSIRVRTGK